MAYLGQAPFQEFTSVPTKDSFTGDGSTTTFDMAGEVSSGSEYALEVFVANVRQEPGQGKAFTLGLDGSGDFKRITFASAPANGASIYVINDKTNQTIVAPTPTDLNGAELILDADGDTSITADSNDRIDFKLGGADHIQFRSSSGDAVIKMPTDAKDIIFQQYDGRSIVEINDAGYVAIANGDSSSGELRIYEDTDNGTNYSGFKVGAQSANIDYILPTADGSDGYQLTTDGSGNLTWAASGAVFSNDGNNRIVTGTGSGTFNGESNLTFDGSTLALTGAATVSTTLTATGNIITSGTVEPAGDTAAGDNAAIGYTAAEGLILTGQGSTNDITIKNDADATVISIPTGTTGVTLAGTLGSGAITSTGIVTGTAFTAGSAVLAEAELELLDGLTAGTAIASKVVTTDSNIDTTGQRNLTITGELDAATGDFSGDVDIDGTLEADAITVNGSSLASVIAGTTVNLATLASTVTITDNENTNENNAIIFTAGGDLDGGNLGLESDGDLHYNPSTGTLSVTNIVTSGTHTVTNSVTMNASNAVVFEGSTADGNETTLTSVDATADHTISLPNQSGTLPVLAAASTTQITTTPAEINLIDGGTARGTDAVASGDGILINDGGTMKMTNVDTVSTYFSSHNVGGGNIVTTGALNSGTITSGFGNIDTGSSTITTTGAVATGALAVTGAITVSSTVDGVDIQTLNTTASAALPKAGGTMTGNLSFGDNNQIRLGASNDLAIYHDGSNSYIVEEGTGNLDITSNGGNVSIQGKAGENSIIAAADGSVSLYYDNALKFQTHNTGCDIEGNLNFGDGEKLQLGAAYDLSIYHDGSDSYIIDSGTGNLVIQTDGNFYVQKESGGENIIRGDIDGAVQLYYDNSSKLATASAGVTISGTLLGPTDVGLNSGDKITWTNDSYTSFYVNGNEEMRLEADGDLHADGDVIAYSTTISDATLKYNINPVEFALDKIQQLKGVTFNYFKDGKESAGLLAQDVEKVMPSAVSERRLPLHKDDDKLYKTLHYDSMTAILVEAIKELTTKLEESTKRIETLENR